MLNGTLVPFFDTKVTLDDIIEIIYDTLVTFDGALMTLDETLI